MDKTEHRAHPRHKVYKGGKVIFNDGASVLDCIVRDESEDGAKLQFEGHFPCPREVKLRISGGPIYNCEVRQFTSTIMRVKFLGKREAVEEELGDLGESDAGRALRAIEGLDLHPAIDEAVGKLFRDGHHADAVRNACMALNNLVQNASGDFDKDGSDLMLHVFSSKHPTLKFNELRDETDKSEQQGMMYLYAGAMQALRNPRSHKFLEYDMETALEAITFVSFLANRLSKAERT